MDRTVTAVLIAAIMAMSCCVLLVSDEGDAATYVAEVGDKQYETLTEAYDAVENNGTIKLLSNVELSQVLKITKPITLDLSEHTIFADEDFTKTGDNNQNSLVSVEYLSSGTVKILNGTLRTGSNNNHALNIFQANDVELADLILDHTVSYRGAPLVVNGSKVNLSGSMTFITGTISWYAVNVDNKSGGTTGATLSTSENTELYFEGTKPDGIVFDTNADGPIKMEFGTGTTAISDITDFNLTKLGENANQDLVNSNSEIVEVNPEPEPIPEPTPTPGYDDDELPPHIPSQSSNDDDTVTIVACAAAAAVAAILAVFLVIDRK